MPPSTGSLTLSSCINFVFSSPFSREWDMNMKEDLLIADWLNIFSSSERETGIFPQMSKCKKWLKIKMQLVCMCEWESLIITSRSSFFYRLLRKKNWGKNSEEKTFFMFFYYNLWSDSIFCNRATNDVDKERKIFPREDESSWLWQSGKCAMWYNGVGVEAWHDVTLRDTKMAHSRWKSHSFMNW